MLVMLIGLLAVSTGSIFVRYAQQYAASLVVAAYRITLASMILTPFAWPRRAEWKGLTRKEAWLGLLSGFFLALHFATWISSLEYTSVASSIVLVTTIPLWVALLSPFTVKEAISRVVLAGMILALLGGAVVGFSDVCTLHGGRLICPPAEQFFSGRAFFGDLLALAGAVTAAAYLIIGRRLRGKLSLLSYIFIVYGAAAITLLALMFASGGAARGYPPQAYLWFLLLALVPQLLGHSSFNWALGYMPTAVVSVMLLGEPIGATLLAYFLLGETPSILKLFGAILILAGIYLASRQRN
jgi:drug/metabolite transporter (DMT)-like permease